MSVNYRVGESRNLTGLYIPTRFECTRLKRQGWAPVCSGYCLPQTARDRVRRDGYGSPLTVDGGEK